MIRSFTRQLVDVYVNQKMGLRESLKIMSGRSGTVFSRQKKISLAADYLADTLEKGKLFSTGIKNCPYINFGENYTAFVLLAENTGNLEQTLLFLLDKYERKKNVNDRLIEASLYPLMIMIMGIGLVIFLSGYTGIMSSFQLLKTVLLMILSFSGILAVIIRVTGNTRLYEAFLAMDFILRSGISLSTAVEYGERIVGPDTKYGRCFEEAREKLEFGLPLHQAMKLGDKFEEGFYFAEKAGGRTEVFGKLAEWLRGQNEHRCKICMSLIEPLFIAFTGIFLLILVVKYFMPFLNNLNYL